MAKAINFIKDLGPSFSAIDEETAIRALQLGVAFIAIILGALYLPE